MYLILISEFNFDFILILNFLFFFALGVAHLQEISFRLENEGWIEKLSAATNEDDRTVIEEEILGNHVAICFPIAHRLALVQEMVNSKLRPIEFQRRIRIIPFLNFSKFEQEVITLQFQDTMTAEFIQPAANDRKIGEIEFHFDATFTKCLVSKYERRSGAAGLTRAVYNEIEKFFSDYSNARPRPEHCYFYYGGRYLKRSWNPPDPSQIFSGSLDGSLCSSSSEIGAESERSTMSSSTSSANTPWTPKSDLKKIQM